MKAPIPGDPQDLQHAAGLLSRAADDVASQSRALQRGTSVASTGWLGAAANAFGAAAGQHGGRLVHAQRALGSLGSAVRGYAIVLEGLQSQTSSLLARRGALAEELRIVRRQQVGAAVGEVVPAGLVEQILAQIRRLDGEVEDLQRQAVTARRRLTATLDGLAPRPLPRAVRHRPPGLTRPALGDLAGGRATVFGAAWSHRMPAVPESTSTGRMHCGPVSPVLADPSRRVTTGPVGQDVGAPPGHRMTTGPVGQDIGAAPGHRMTTGPVGQDIGAAPGHRMRTGPVSPVLVDPTRHVTTGPVQPMS